MGLWEGSWTPLGRDTGNRNSVPGGTSWVTAVTRHSLHPERSPVDSSSQQSPTDTQPHPWHGGQAGGMVHRTITKNDEEGLIIQMPKMLQALRN